MTPGTAAAAAASPDGECHDSAPSSVLIDIRAYGAARRNASTATSTTSNGHPIEVTFYTARPPVLAHFNVHCPGLQLPPNDGLLMPKAIAADGDLFLFRVPVDPKGKHFYYHNDYFVYTAHPQHPKLDLLPKCDYTCFGDNELAVLSYGGGAADGYRQYAVAGLGLQAALLTMKLHIYRSGSGGEPGSWTSSEQRLSPEELIRDKVCPIPRDARMILDHLTTKVIVIGGPRGTVGWVDLWRGILFCDVLDESPKLRDLPLPLPARGNWKRFVNGCPYYCRDIAVGGGRRKDSIIKYVEMEIVHPTAVPPSRPEPATYIEWLHQKENPPQPTSYSWVHGGWKATVWSMRIPIGSWEDWHLECTANSGELSVDDPKHYQLLHKLRNSGSDKETAEETLSLGFLRMAHPTLSIDGHDVVYLMTKPAGSGETGAAVMAVDLRRKKLQGVAKLNSERNSVFWRCFLASGISQHLKTTGT
ncbi:unnamed protein product [Urochloa humidicola]